MAHIPPYRLRQRRAGSYHDADTFPDGPASSALDKAVKTLNQEAFPGNAVARVDALLTAAIYGQSPTLQLLYAAEPPGTRADIKSIADWFYTDAITSNVPITLKRCQHLASRLRVRWPHCFIEQDTDLLRQCVWADHGVFLIH
jgi:hypothetical protein